MPNLENYHKEKLTIDLGKANVFALSALIPIILVFAVPYYLIWKDKQFTGGAFVEMISSSIIQKPISFVVIFILVLAGGIVLHELIHGITWAIFAEKGFKSIKFGILKEMITPYCHCKEPLKVSQYIIGGIMPAILLGIIPAIVAIAIGNFALLCFGIFFTVTACGDFLIISLLKNEKASDYVQDHPSEAGCYIYRKKEIGDRK